jgi:alpha-tubulin suppressor-like RCC1 family protein
VNSTGTEISFTAQLATPGLKTLRVSQANGAQQVSMPAAALLTQAITLQKIETNNLKGGVKSLSDSGGNQIVVEGLGLNGNLSVHLIPYNEGFVIGSSNRVAYRFSNGKVIVDQSPKVIPGKQYQLVIARAETSEVVSATGSLLLTGIDDTAPIKSTAQGSSSSLGMNTPITISFNEPVNAGGFTVIKQFKDYTATPDQNISSRFEMVNLSAQVISLRLLPGEVLDNNAVYQVTITNIADTNLNLAAGSGSLVPGEHKESFIAPDTLAPRNLRLVRAVDNQDVNQAMLLTRGRAYQFKLSAVDNYAGAINFSYRLSTAFGAADSGVLRPDKNNQIIYKAEKQHSYVEFRVEASDGSPVSLRAAANFRASLRDPIIELESFTTDPLEPEESVRSAVKFDLTGDVDMVTKTLISVDKIKASTTDVTSSYNFNDGSVFASFINPKIRDILTNNEPIQPVQMKAMLSVDYGYDFNKVFEQSYLLYLDRTPPTLEIVSPKNGDFIALGEKTDVLLKSFDKYGIESVQVSRDGGPWETLATPNLYSFEATNAEMAGITIAARAIDPNQNISNVQTIKVYPYDAEAGAPKVDIIAPDNGSQFQEGETVRFEVLLRNVLDADLYLDIGGVEASTPSVHITRNMEDAERQFVNVELPPINENIVILARLQKANLKAYKFLNVANDEGIDENLDLTITPARKVLTGSALWVDAKVPQSMIDFSNDSRIFVKDPIDSVTEKEGRIGEQLVTRVTTQGSQLSVNTLLKDKSEHQKTDQTVLDKIPFLSDAPAVSYVSAINTNEVLFKAIAIPGVTQSENVLVAFNNIAGGYRLSAGSRLIEQSTKGEITAVEFSGAFLLAQIQQNGEHFIKRYPLGASGIQASDLSYPVAGDLLGANGSLVWMSYGKSIGASIIANQDSVVVAAQSLQEPIVATKVDGQFLYVLTASGLYQFVTNNLNGVVQVQQTHFVALQDQQGLEVDAENVFTWNNSTLGHYQLLSDGSLLPVEITQLPGIIEQIISDDELTWVKSKIGNQYHWFAVQSGELVGILPTETGSDIGHTQLVVTPTNLYLDRLENGVVSLIALAIQTAQENANVNVAINQLTQEIALTPSISLNSLGKNVVHLETESGQLIPAFIYYQDGIKQLRIARSQLPDGDIQLITRTYSLNKSVDVSVDITTQVQTLSTPFASANFTRGAQIPASVLVSPNNRINSQSLVTDNKTLSMATLNNVGVQWLSIPSVGTSVNWLHQVNNQAYATGVLNVVNNQPELAQVTVISPANNAAVNSGEPLHVQYTLANTNNDAFHYAEVSLFDFNRRLISNLLVASSSGQLALHMPVVTVKDTYYLRVRGYWGDTYRYSESEVSLQLYPQLGMPEPKLSGVSSRVFAATQVNYKMDVNNLENYQSRIEVRDDSDNLIASGTSLLSMTVPNNLSHMTVVATLTDKNGQSKSTSYDVNVVAGVTLEDVEQGKQFAVILPDVDRAWLAVGRQLRDQNNQVLANMDANITAMARLGDRLLLGLDNQGLAIVDPAENFMTLGFYSMQGQISDIAINGENLLIIANNKLQAFTVSGNWISPASLQLLSNNRLFTYANDQDALDIQISSNGFVVLRHDSAIRVDQQFIVDDKRTVDIADAVAMAHTGNRWFVATENQIVSFDENSVVLRHEKLETNIEHFIVDGRYLIGLNASGRVQIFDALNSFVIEKVGDFSRGALTSPNKAKLFSGAVWLGDANGSVIKLQQPAGTILTSYTTESPKGQVMDVDIANGQVLAAASYYGSLYHSFEKGMWKTRSYPNKGWSLSIDKVLFDDTYAYLSLADQHQLIAVNRLSLNQQDSPTSQNIFNGIAISNIALTNSLILASEANNVHLANRKLFSQKDKVSLPAGENIVSMTAHGEVIYASTNNRRLYKIIPGPLPVNQYKVIVESIVDGATDVIQHLEVSGDYLFFNVGSSIHRIDLNTYQDQIVDIPSSLAINALEYANGNLWVAHRTATNSEIRVIDVATWNLNSVVQIPLNQIATSLAEDKGMLVVGLGSDGIKVFDLNGQLNQVDPTLNAPDIGKVYVQGEYMTLGLSTIDAVNSVHYYVNDQLIGGSAEYPFALTTLVPPYLRNGQPFYVVVEVESLDGTISRSHPRKLALQGENLPANPFSVVIVNPKLGVPSYVPKPLELRAEVNNSSQAIHQVEYYEASSVDGPFKIIGKHYGPEFVIYRNYGVTDSGKWLKVRAIDVFGNVTESAAVQIQRIEDTGLPMISPMSLTGAVIGNTIIEKHAYQLSMNVSDAQSGIESAILRRNGIIIAARFEEGQLVVNEKGALKDQQLTYVLDVTDKAGNRSQLTNTYSVIEDTAPIIQGLIASPAQMLEQGAVTVQMTARDQVSVEKLEFAWNGFTQQVAIKPSAVVNVQQVLRDRRTERVQADLPQSLLVRVTDDLGQITEQNLPITVVADKIPDASKLSLSYPMTGFYGESIPLTMNGFTQANDGLDPIVVSVINTNPAGKELRVEHKNPSAELRQVISLPANDIADNQFRFKIRLMDQLGQSNDTADQSVMLTYRPNALRFFQTSEQKSFNPSYITVGMPTLYQLEIVDRANRRVPYQRVRWSLQEIISSGVAPVQDLGVTQSDTNGLAQLNFNSSIKTGRYKLMAALVDSPQINVAIGIRLIAGETKELRFDFVGPVKAGELSQFTIRGYDVGGNWTEYDSQTKVRISLGYSGFHFGFANGVVAQPLSGGEVAVVQMQNGQAIVPVTVAQTVGEYAALLSFDAPDTSVIATYDFENNQQYTMADEINIQVLPNDPYIIGFAEVARTNAEFGEELRLEQTETVTLEATLYDKFNNAITYLDALDNPVPADLTFIASVDGAAVINSASAEEFVELVEGKGTFEVSTNEVETVHVTGSSLVPLLSGFAKFDTLELDFLKLKPAIDLVEIPQVVDSLITPISFSFTEALQADTLSSSALSIKLNGVNLPGEFGIDADDNGRLIFIPAQSLELGACYTINSSASPLRGLAANDSLLPQNLTTCAHKGRLSLPSNQYVLENTQYVMTPQVASGINLAALRGTVSIYALDQPLSSANFNGAAPLVRLPTFTGTSYQDGQKIQLSVNALNGNETIPFANAITLHILTVNGDFDNDGVPNALELSLNLNPANYDSDGDGINDGDDDLDNDGLTNAEEIALKTKLNAADSDADGLNDYDEVNVHLSNPNKTDSDGDGIPDFVEVISESDPANANEIDIDPTYITAVDVQPSNLVHQLGIDPANFRLTVKATFSYQGKVFTQIDVSNFTNLLFFATNNTAVATVNSEGVFTPVAEGEAQLSVTVFGATTLVKTVSLKVEKPSVADSGAILEAVSGGSVLWNNGNLWLWGFELQTPYLFDTSMLNGAKIVSIVAVDGNRSLHVLLLDSNGIIWRMDVSKKILIRSNFNAEISSPAKKISASGHDYFAIDSQDRAWVKRCSATSDSSCLDWKLPELINTGNRPVDSIHAGLVVLKDGTRLQFKSGLWSPTTFLGMATIRASAHGLLLDNQNRIWRVNGDTPELIVTGVEGVVWDAVAGNASVDWPLLSDSTNKLWSYYGGYEFSYKANYADNYGRRPPLIGIGNGGGSAAFVNLNLDDPWPGGRGILTGPVPFEGFTDMKAGYVTDSEASPKVWFILYLAGATGNESFKLANPVFGELNSSDATYGPVYQGNGWIWEMGIGAIPSSWYSPGQLSIRFGENFEEKYKQVDLSVLQGAQVVKTSSSGNHHLLLDSLGRVWAWGQNSRRELGVGSTDTINTPVQVGSLGQPEITVSDVPDVIQIPMGRVGSQKVSSISIARSFNVLSVRFENPHFELLQRGNSFVIKGESIEDAVYVNPSVCTQPGEKIETIKLIDDKNRVLMNSQIKLNCVPDIASQIYSSSMGTELAFVNNNYDAYSLHFNWLNGSAPSQVSLCSGCKVSITNTFACSRYAGEILGQYSILDENSQVVGTQQILCPRSDVKSVGERIALNADGQAFSWPGNQINVQSSNVNKWVSLSSKGDNILLLDDQDRLWFRGTVWISESSSYVQASPILINQSSDGAKWISGAVGESHVVALDSLGRLWSWGRNQKGQLGIGNFDFQATPQLLGISILNGAKWIAVAAGDNHNLALDDQGRLWAWGDNTNGKLGIGNTSNQTTPQLVNAPSNGAKWVSVTAGANHSIALDDQGRAWVWGRNNSGQLGIPPIVQPGSTYPQLPLGTNANGCVTTVIGFNQTFNGNLSSGDCTNSARGSSYFTDRYTFNGKAGDKIYIKLTGSFDAYLYLKNPSNTVIASDDDSAGGGGSRIPGSSWLTLPVTGTYSIEATSYSVAASGSYGLQLAIDSVVLPEPDVLVPTLMDSSVLNGAKWQSISSGYAHNLGLDDQNRLWSWGYNGNGQLGIGNNTQQNAPVLVDVSMLNDTDWIEFNASGERSVAKDKVGNIWSWGYGSGSRPQFIGNVFSNLDVSFLPEDSIQIEIGSDGKALLGVVGLSSESLYKYNIRANHSAVKFDKTDSSATSLFLQSYETNLYLDSSFCRLPGYKPLNVTLKDQTGKLYAQHSYNVLCTLDLSVENKLVNDSNEFTYQNTSGLELRIQFNAVEGVTVDGESSVEQAVCAGCEWKVSTDQLCSERQLLRSLGQVSVFQGETLVGEQTLYCPIIPASLRASASYTSTLLDSNKNLWAWGRVPNTGDSRNRPELVKKSEKINASWVTAASSNYSLVALDNEGKLWIDDKKFEAHVKFVGLNAGDYEFIALDERGQIWEWSYDSLPTLKSSSQFDGNKIITFSTFSYRAVAIDEQMQLWQWSTPFGQPNKLGGQNKWIAVAQGEQHTLALDDQGQLWAWGMNYARQLGNGILDYTLSNPTLVDTSFLGNAKVKQISAGGNHSLLLDDENRLWVWGSDGVRTNYLTQQFDTNPLGSAEIISIAAGSNFSLIMDDANRVWSWGGNNYGELGHSFSGETLYEVGTSGVGPVHVEVDLDTNALSIPVGSTGKIQIASLDIENNYFSRQQLYINNPVFSVDLREIVGPTSFVVGLSLDRQICTQSGEHILPLTITDSNQNIVLNNQIKVVCEPVLNVSSSIINGNASFKISGSREDYLVKVVGSSGVEIDGQNAVELPLCSGCRLNFATNHQCSGNSTQKIGRLDVTNFEGSTLESINLYCPRLDDQRFATGDSGEVFYIDDNQQLWVWGSGDLGLNTLGSGAVFVPVPSPIYQPRGWYQITNNLALDGHRKLWSVDYSMSPLSEFDQPNSDWIHLYASAEHKLALDSNGQLWAWGENSSGQLGIGNNLNQSDPQLIDAAAIGVDKWSTAAVGQEHSLAVDDQGRLWVWGNNQEYQLGLGDDISVNTPQLLNSEVKWVSVFAHGWSSYAIDEFGRIWQWGEGFDESSTVPVLMSNAQLEGAKWVKLSVSNHILGIDDQGRLWAWGSNGSGELGIGHTAYVDAPEMVLTPWQDDAVWIDVVATVGRGQGWGTEAGVSVGLDSKGRVWSWGGGPGLGLGENVTQALAPARVPFPKPNVRRVPILAVRELIGAPLDRNFEAESAGTYLIKLTGNVSPQVTIDGQLFYIHNYTPGTCLLGFFSLSEGQHNIVSTAEGGGIGIGDFIDLEIIRPELDDYLNLNCDEEVVSEEEIDTDWWGRDWWDSDYGGYGYGS